jgi:hypothetical protein
MAKNTGRGTRAAANSPTSVQFLQAKKRGGAFKGIRDERSWTARHDTTISVVLSVLVTACLLAFLVLFLLEAL